MPSMKTIILSLSTALQLVAADFYIVSGINTFEAECPGLPVCFPTEQKYTSLAATNAFSCDGDLGRAEQENGELGLLCNSNPPDPDSFTVPIPEGVCGITGDQILQCDFNGLAGYSCALQSDIGTILATCGTDQGCATSDSTSTYTPLDSATCVNGPGSTTIWNAFLLCTAFGDKHLGIC